MALDENTLWSLRLYFGGVRAHGRRGAVDVSAADDASAAFCGNKSAMKRTLKRLQGLPLGWSEGLR